MKSLLLVLTFLVLAQFSHQKTKFESCTDEVLNELNSLASGTNFDNTCQVVRCNGSGFSALTCPVSTCQAGHEIGYKEEDNSKVYPECCGYPICDNV